MPLTSVPTLFFWKLKNRTPQSILMLNYLNFHDKSNSVIFRTSSSTWKEMLYYYNSFSESSEEVELAEGLVKDAEQESIQYHYHGIYYLKNIERYFFVRIRIYTIKFFIIKKTRRLYCSLSGIVYKRSP